MIFEIINLTLIKIRESDEGRNFRPNVNNSETKRLLDEDFT